MNHKKTGRKYLSQEEFDKLLAAIPAKDEKYRVLFTLAGRLGLRIGEALRIKVEDIDFKEQILHAPTLKKGIKKGSIKGTIKRGERPKTFIEMPLSKSRNEASDITKAIKTYLKRQGITKGWLFPDKDGVHIPYWKAWEHFKAYCQKAGIKGTTHSLRHYRAMDIYNKTKDVKMVQDVLRHSSLQSTQHYLNEMVSIDEKRRVMYE